VRIHIIAVGGAVMHALALELARKGHHVTGSDDKIFDPARQRLAEAGLLPPVEGWFPEKLSGEVDLVLLGMHARKDNPELQKALQLGLRIQSFPEFLGQWWHATPQVVVAGSHGKTTVTAMLIHVLKSASRNFDYLAGSRIPGCELNVKLSESAPLAVIEGDEYLTSPLDPRPKFMHYKPSHLVLTGIAWDHANVFADEESYKDAFRQRLATLEAGTVVHYDATDCHLRELIEEFERAEWLAVPYFPLPCNPDNAEPHFFTSEGRNIKTKVFGQHNLKNMSAVLSVCRKLNISETLIYDALATFEGAGGRLELLWNSGPNMTYKDFAHAPSKVRATVQAVRHRYPHHRLVAVLELHTYSSLSPAFLPGYGGSLEMADAAYVFFDNEALALKKLPLVKPEVVAEAFGAPAIVVPDDVSSLAEQVAKELQEPFVLLLMSSGHWKDFNWKSWLEKRL
jgi:UDP-N-acetylmuramate: L-alanyl-gamma-D-glutamyl-meso-diaminopimelate ligase